MRRRRPRSRRREAFGLVAKLGIGVLLLLTTVIPCTRGDVPESVRVLGQRLDVYGPISFEDERARLDNFAVHLMMYPGSIGYILVHDGNNMCEGEAQARAMRAKRYVVEHRGVPWNRVIWRFDGYDDEFGVFLQPQLGPLLQFPFLGSTRNSPKRYVTRNCRRRISRIKNTKW